MIAHTDYRPLIDTVASAHGLDPDLVEAVVWTESSGHTDAFRYEPEFWDRYLKGTIAYGTQIPRRVSSSYGLMQVMFSTAVEYGFTQDPEVLFQPAVGLEYGCRVLADNLKWANGDARKALAAYNAGRGNALSVSGQSYASSVLATKDAHA